MALTISRTALQCLNLGRQSAQCRFLSLSATRHQNVDSTVDPKGYTLISMNKGPANSLSQPFLAELKEAIEEAEKTKGILLTSSLPTIFSAGLEITEMYNAKEESLREFWSTLQDTYLALYGCKVPTVAAINGHSPAGGCLLAMLCDYRVMVGPKFTIGLNETKLGIIAPWWFKNAMSQTIGIRQTEMALMLGTLFSTDQALSIGLIDKSAANKEEAMEEAEKMLIQLMNIPSQARHLTKMMMREESINRLRATKNDDIDVFTGFLTRPEVQAGMGMYLEALKNRKKKKAN